MTFAEVDGCMHSGGFVFCGDCGARLMWQCGGCATRNKNAQKFCVTCGEAAGRSAAEAASS